MHNTRPDILFRVGLVSRFMESPTMTHFNAEKRILRYVRYIGFGATLFTFTRIQACGGIATTIGLEA